MEAQDSHWIESSPPCSTACIMVCRLFQNYLYGNNNNNNREGNGIYNTDSIFVLHRPGPLKNRLGFLFCTDSVFVKNRVGFCQKSTRFFSCTDSIRWKIDSVFVVHRLGFCQKSTRFFSSTDSVRWKIDSVFVVHWLGPLKNRLGFVCLALTLSAEQIFSK